MKRLVLVRHAPTASTRAAAFPQDEPLDEAGRAQAATLKGRLPGRGEQLSSPARRCRQTAEAAGLNPTIDPDLADCDFGEWAGRTLAEIHAEDPKVVEAWMGDPSAAPHGGESLEDFFARVGRWMERQASGDGWVCAVTHSGVARAAVAHAVEAPIGALWRIDIAPASVTELHAHDGRWTVTYVNCIPQRRTAPGGEDELPAAEQGDLEASA
jgi:broad specificity phosphatase PhoE